VKIDSPELQSCFRFQSPRPMNPHSPVRPTIFPIPVERSWTLPLVIGSPRICGSKISCECYVNCSVRSGRNTPRFPPLLGRCHLLMQMGIVQIGQLSDTSAFRTRGNVLMSLQSTLHGFSHSQSATIDQWRQGVLAIFDLDWGERGLTFCRTCD
jgi:hypothetical protein